MNGEFETIESDELNDVTGAGKWQTVGKVAKWGWNQVDRGLTALGVYEAGRAVYDYATGGNQQPAQPAQPAEGAPQ